MRLLATGVLLTFIGAAAGVSAAPTAFKGVPLGAESAEAMKLIELDEVDAPLCGERGAEHRACFSRNSVEKWISNSVKRRLGDPPPKSPTRITYAGYIVKGLTLHFLRGKFQGAEVSIASSVMNEVVAALKGQYGDPKVEKVVFKSRAGAEFDNEIYTWRTDDAVISARRLSESVDTGEVQVTSFELARSLEREQAMRHEKAKRDL